jgi:hypothetical protein
MSSAPKVEEEEDLESEERGDQQDESGEQPPGSECPCPRYRQRGRPGTARRDASGLGPTQRRGPSPGEGRYGYETMSTGFVFLSVGAPTSFTTWSIVPLPEIDRSRMSCSFTPGVTGTSKAWLAWIVGSTLKKQ